MHNIYTFRLKRLTLLSTLHFCFSFAIFAQVTTVSGFNYYDVNADAFTVDASCFGVSEELENTFGYNFTALDLANRINAVFNNGEQNVDEVVGDYVIRKRPFLNKTLGGETYRWILIRPNDDIVRPTILVTHGGQGSGATPLRLLSFGVPDYVQRGYAVVYYQSGPFDVSEDEELATAFEDAGFTEDCIFGGWTPDEEILCFQQAVFMKYQFVQAAIDFAAGNHEAFNLDPDLFFASGFSGGAVGTLYAALGDEDNFDDAIFEEMGTYRNLSQFPKTDYQLKAVATLAGGILGPTSTDFKIGNVVDEGDAETRFLMFHGQDDNAVQPGTSPLFWTDPMGALPGSQVQSTLDLAPELSAAGIENKVVVNCSACHALFTWPCKYNDDCHGNNPIFDLGFCTLWTAGANFSNIDFDDLCSSDNDPTFWPEIGYILAQAHDFCRISASYFHEDFSDVGPVSPGNDFVETLLNDQGHSAVNAADYPYNRDAGLTNGFWAFSDKCLQQNCKGLYFNRLGGSDLLGTNFKGDYIELPRFEGANIFNDDFTMELRFKAIDHEGDGVLFSLLNNGAEGFEVKINTNGFIQFRRNSLLGGQGNIIGETSVKDSSCHYVVLTREGNEFGLYLDGVLQEQKKNFNVNFPSPAKYRIGNSSNQSLFNGDNGFNGIIRDLKIWTTVLPVSSFGQTTAENNMDQLLAYWPMDEGVGQEIFNTVGTDTIVLGNSTTTAEFDPRWMRDDELCACDSDILVETSELVQIAEFDLINIYPNPNNGTFVIEQMNDQQNEMTWRMYDARGKLIKKGVLNTPSEVIKIETAGIYFLEVQSGVHREYRKVVVQ